MQRARYLLKRKTPRPIQNPADAKITLSSGVEIYRQIRILPRDAYGEWPFEHEKKPDPIFEGPLDDGSRDIRSHKRLRIEPKKWGKRKASQEEDEDVFIDDGGYPSYSLLDEWGPDLKDEEIAMDEMKKDKGKMIKQEISDEEEQLDVERKSQATVSGHEDLTMGDCLDHFPAVKKMLSFNDTGSDLKDEEIDVDEIKKDKGKMTKQEINDEEEQLDVERKGQATVSGHADLTMGDYLDHFPAVKKIFNFNDTRPKCLEFPKMPSLVDRPVYLAGKELLPSCVTLSPNLKQVTPFIGQAKPVVMPWSHPQVPPHLQRRWIKACTVMTRYLRFI
ncbi:unnamed protein product [Urochloa humidicola]